MKAAELIPGKYYIGIDKDGNEHEAVKIEGDIIISLFPAFTIDGELNDLIDFKEADQ